MAKFRFAGRVIKKNKTYVDFPYLITVCIMIAFGLIMVFSASSAVSVRLHGDSWAIFRQQAAWVAVGAIGMFVASNYDYKKLGKWANIGLGITIVMHIAVLIPGLGISVGGATRWLGTQSVRFQPSEFAKIALILFFARHLSTNASKLKTFKGLLFPYMVVIGIMGGLLMFQPHFSATLLISVTLIVMLFVAGAKLWHFAVISAPAVPLLIWLVISAPYRLRRITAFLDPFNPEFVREESFQIVQSLYAIGSGGIFGVGLGRSRQKFLYLPEPHNDFIFSVIAEELGWIGVILVISLFIFLIKRGIKIAANAPDAFGTFLAVGITTLIGFQALVNIAVVTSSMPVTGMQLPFFSYGGTAMAVIMTAMGVMLNISRQSSATQL
ncbi:MAG: putative lipid II flippase FtsW [Oscillospiraceae bacterium]|nr:putative lipid II flippase FtsW [Oscillospiraceae bacterium]